MSSPTNPLANQRSDQQSGVGRGGATQANPTALPNDPNGDNTMAYNNPQSAFYLPKQNAAPMFNVFQASTDPNQFMSNDYIKNLNQNFSGWQANKGNAAGFDQNQFNSAWNQYMTPGANYDPDKYNQAMGNTNADGTENIYRDGQLVGKGQLAGQSGQGQYWGPGGTPPTPQQAPGTAGAQQPPGSGPIGGQQGQDGQSPGQQGGGKPSQGSGMSPGGAGGGKPSQGSGINPGAAFGGYNSWGNPGKGNPYAYMTGVQNNGFGVTPQYLSPGFTQSQMNPLGGQGNMSGLSGLYNNLAGMFK